MTSYDTDIYYRDPDYKAVNDAYSLCILGLILSYLSIVAACVLALKDYKRLKDTPYQSHMTYIVLGSLYYTLFLVIVVVLIIAAVRLQLFARGYFFAQLTLFLLPPFFLLAWWIARFARGLRLLRAHRPIPHPLLPTLPR